MELNRETLKDLREILADLYQDGVDSQRVAHDAGIDARHIAFDKKAVNTWFAIVGEAEKLGRVPALIDVTRKDYGGNARLEGWIARTALSKAATSLDQADAGGALDGAAAVVASALATQKAQGGKLPAATANSLRRFRQIESSSRRAAVPSIDEGAEAVTLAGKISVDVGLVDKVQVDAIRSAAARRSAVLSPSPPLTLDRFEQRAALDNLIGDRPRVAAFLTHGEAEQGHARLVEWARFKLRDVLQVECRKEPVGWPDRGAGAGTRLNMLVEELARTLKLAPVRIEAMLDPDPMSSESAEAWDRGLDPLQRVLAKSSRCWLLYHHIVGPSADDADLVTHYLRRVWAPIAKMPGRGTFMLAFGVVHAPSGVPLVSPAWYVSRRERGASRRIVRAFDEEISFEHARALPELKSVLEDHVVTWLRERHKLPPERAQAHARSALAGSRGGRFDLVVERIDNTVFR